MSAFEGGKFACRLCQLLNDGLISYSDPYTVYVLYVGLSLIRSQNQTPTQIQILSGLANFRSPIGVYTGSFLPDAWIGALASAATCAAVLASLSLAKKNDDFSLLQTTSFSLFFAQIGRRFPAEPGSSSSRLAFASISLGGFITVSIYR